MFAFRKNLVVQCFPVIFLAACGGGDVSLSESVKEDEISAVDTQVKNGGNRQIERLTRGLVAYKISSSQILVSWRYLASDRSDIAFNVYQHDADAPYSKGVRLNPSGTISKSTNFLVNNGNTGKKITLVPVLNGSEQPSSVSSIMPWQDNFIELNLDRPSGKNGVTYTASDASIGDLGGNGTYELIVKWEPSDAKDNSHPGETSNVYIDAYRMSGEKDRLWRIDLGNNIRAGAHYTQFMVYDFDGDGKSELIMKTADGTRDGRGNYIGDRTKNYVHKKANETIEERRKEGRILTGPEYLTVFRGLDGAALVTVPFSPGRGSESDWASTWGDAHGNRMDRFLAGVAYLDGARPSLIFGRGYYQRSVVTAWDFRSNGGQYSLTRRWQFDTHNGRQEKYPDYVGQGFHSLAVADVNFDGRDDVVYGNMVLNSDGKPIHSTKRGHGDMLFVSDFDPDRSGLEIFTVHEDPEKHKGQGAVLRYGNSGVTIAAKGVCKNGVDTTRPEDVDDVGRGIIMDVDPNHKGAEFWAINSAEKGRLFNVKGNALTSCGAQPDTPLFGVYWDGDLLREQWHRKQSVRKWVWQNNGIRSLTEFDGFVGLGDEDRPNLVADIAGDWREEIVLRNSSSTKMRIYFTPFDQDSVMLAPNSTQSVPRIRTLMHDTHYRVAVARQNSAYNQMPNTSFYLGNGMGEQPAIKYYYPN